MHYEVIQLFLIILSTPFFHYRGIPDMGRSEVVPSAIKGKSEASSDSHSLLLIIEIDACTYPLD